MRKSYVVIADNRSSYTTKNLHEAQLTAKNSSLIFKGEEFRVISENDNSIIYAYQNGARV